MSNFNNVSAVKQLEGLYQSLGVSPDDYNWGGLLTMIKHYQLSDARLKTVCALLGATTCGDIRTTSGQTAPRTPLGPDWSGAISLLEVNNWDIKRAIMAHNGGR